MLGSTGALNVAIPPFQVLKGQGGLVVLFDLCVG